MSIVQFEDEITYGAGFITIWNESSLLHPAHKLTEITEFLGLFSTIPFLRWRFITSFTTSSTLIVLPSHLHQIIGMGIYLWWKECFVQKNPHLSSKICCKPTYTREITNYKRELNFSGWRKSDSDYSRRPETNN